MHQDIAFSRPTEIDYINGYVVKMANKLNVLTPLNQQLVEQVKSLENKKQPT
jgi:2-dehydropantoate 2-reductase